MARNANYSRKEAKREAKAPSFIAYAVTEKGEDKSFWTRIGAAWDHEDGKGLTLAARPGSGERTDASSSATPSEGSQEKGA